MNNLKYFFATVIFSLLFMGCSDDSDNIVEPNPMEDLMKIYEFPADGYAIEIYSENPELEVGYNKISLRIKDVSNNEYVTNANLSWMPVMHMETKEHSAPHTALDNSENNSVYTGAIVFQMPSNETEYWDLQLTFSANGQTITKTDQINVLQPADGLKKIQVFVGNDDAKYVLAYVEPQVPEIGINDFEAVLYKMEDMMTFPLVENYTITVDPRMPGMDNHSSPNNQDLVYNAVSKMYEGKLSLTMTGYWKINLKLINQSGETVKGEDVTEDNPASSLYFELEF
ncbi:MAG: hypothetical protein WBL21_11900 [Salinimicrobium sp.]